MAAELIRRTMDVWRKMRRRTTGLVLAIAVATGLISTFSTREVSGQVELAVADTGMGQSAIYGYVGLQGYELRGRRRFWRSIDFRPSTGTNPEPPIIEDIGLEEVGDRAFSTEYVATLQVPYQEALAQGGTLMTRDEYEQHPQRDPTEPSGVIEQSTHVVALTGAGAPELMLQLPFEPEQAFATLGQSYASLLFGGDGAIKEASEGLIHLKTSYVQRLCDEALYGAEGTSCNETSRGELLCTSEEALLNAGYFFDAEWQRFSEWCHPNSIVRLTAPLSGVEVDSNAGLLRQIAPLGFESIATAQLSEEMWEVRSGEFTSQSGFYWYDYTYWRPNPEIFGQVPPDFQLANPPVRLWAVLRFKEFGSSAESVGVVSAPRRISAWRSDRSTCGRGARYGVESRGDDAEYGAVSEQQRVGGERLLSTAHFSHHGHPIHLSWTA